MSDPDPRSAFSGATLAVLLGAAGGFLLLWLATSEYRLGAPRVDRSGRVAIHINGVSQKMARDLFLPTRGWVIQIRFDDFTPEETRAGLVVRLRSERTGASIEIQDRFVHHENFASLKIPEQLGLSAGLLSIRATLTDATGLHFEDSRRIRIRSSLGGLPIGVRQVIHFDFEVDHDGDGVPDFWKDLERFGLASASDPALSRFVAEEIEARALARVEAAYDPVHDPNGTGESRDTVTIRFRPTDDPAALTTRICVGGRDPTERGLVGHVGFDLRNENKDSLECAREPAAGLFPAELETYRDSALYSEVLDPFLASRGGFPIGEHPDDSVEGLSDPAVQNETDMNPSSRRVKLQLAIAVLGDVLGSIMAHEAGHALGLVAEGKPSVGLFGGSDGQNYAHNLAASGGPETSVWLMNPGQTLRFEELAGKSTGGPLSFRPLNHAYLRDRVVVSEKR